MARMREISGQSLTPTMEVGDKVLADFDTGPTFRVSRGQRHQAMNEILLFLGLVVLTAAFLSYGHPVLRRLGVLCVGATTFAAGYLLSRNVWVGTGLRRASGCFSRGSRSCCACANCGCRCVSSSASPPRRTRDMFPELSDLSDEIESAGFEHVADLGWDMDGYRQFLRLFANPEKPEEAAITYVEQNQLGFHFASVTSPRVRAGTSSPRGIARSPPA